MADHTTLNAGSGGDDIATDDIGAYKIPYSKIVSGGNGVDGGFISDSNPFEVNLRSATIDVMLGTDFSAVLGSSNIVATAGSAALALGIQAMGSDGTNARALATESDGALHIHDGGNSITVDAASLPLPTGASTAANQSTGNTSLGNIDTNTTDVPNVIGTDGVAGPTRAVSVGGTESGGNLQEVRVDSDGHLQVDVLSGGGGTEYTEDAAAPGNPVGGAAQLVRADTPGTIASADGDWVAQRGTNYGAAYCQLVTSSGSFIDSVGGGTEFAVDTAAGGTDLGKLVLAVRDDTLGTLTPADGDYTQLRTNNRGAQWVQHDGNLTVDAGTGWQTAVTEDAAATGGESGPYVMGHRSDADTSPVSADGDYHGLIFDNAGNLKVNVKAGSGSATEYTEDVAAPSDPQGPAQALRYRSSPTSEAGTAGDWVIRGSTQYGAAFCQLVTSAGAFIDSVGGGTEFQVDAAAGGTDLGKLVLAVRDDALTTLTPVDGDYTQLRTNNRGAQWVAHDGALSVDWNGTAPPIGAGTEAAALRVTVATDSTGVLTVDDGGGSLTVDNADITTIAGAVSGSEMQVDVVGALPAGTNNIGDVDVATQPARTKTTDNVGVAQDSEVLMDGTTANTVKTVNVDTATSGDNALIAAVASKTHKIVSVALFASGAVDIYFNDGTANILGGTRKVKLDNTGAAGPAGFVLGHNPQGWFKTAADNRPVNLNLSAGVGIAGTISYVEV